MKYRGQSVWAVLLILCSLSCLDRINIDVGPPIAYPIVIDGFISDQPGPYLIKVTSANDIESKVAYTVPLSVKSMTISDDQGNSESLNEMKMFRGFYVTSPSGIRGIVGRVYRLRVETLDDRIYESKPDTLYPTGTVDKVYFQFRSDFDENGSINYGFNVFFNSSAGEKNKYRFLWKFNGTYRADISCCFCWVPIKNKIPLVSDGQLVNEGRFLGVEAGYVPVTGYTFMYKVHAEVDQLSLSRQSFDFWRAVRYQMNSTGSLFQPVTGIVPNNFVQLSGPESPILGIFYAAAISSNAVYIKQSDVPNQQFIPKLQLAPNIGNFIPASSCTVAFPNSTSIRPSFWVD